MIELGTVVRRRTCVRRNRWRVIFETCMNVAVELIAPPEIGVDERASSCVTRNAYIVLEAASVWIGSDPPAWTLQLQARLALDRAVELLSRKEPGPSAASASPSGSGRSQRLLACYRPPLHSTPGSRIHNSKSYESHQRQRRRCILRHTTNGSRGAELARSEGTFLDRNAGDDDAQARRHADVPARAWEMETRGADQRRTPNALIGRPSAPCGARAPRPVAGARVGDGAATRERRRPTACRRRTSSHNLKARGMRDARVC